MNESADRLYKSQKANAAKRGIEWKFTFEEWLAFWGDDLHKRGRGHDRLCMMRFSDSGPYSPENTRKGYARDNMRTAGVLRKARNIEKKTKFQQSQDDFQAIREAFFGKGE